MIATLTTEQAKALSDLLFDSAKILLGSVILGFFVPAIIGPISVSGLVSGSAIALLCIAIGLKLLNNK